MLQHIGEPEDLKVFKFVEAGLVIVSALEVGPQIPTPIRMQVYLILVSHNKLALQVQAPIVYLSQKINLKVLQVRNPVAFDPLDLSFMSLIIYQNV